MARIPKRLAGPGLLSGSAVTRYTTPSTTKTVVKHIHASNIDTVARLLTISIGSDATGTRILDQFSLTAAGTTGCVLDLYPYYVLEAAEIIQAFADSANKINLTIDGDELVLG